VPNLPRDEGGPVFREPWEARVFAITLALYQRGVFTWPEWTAALSDAIKRAPPGGDPSRDDTYYRHSRRRTRHYLSSAHGGELGNSKDQLSRIPCIGTGQYGGADQLASGVPCWQDRVNPLSITKSLRWGLGPHCRQHPDTNLIDASEQIFTVLDGDI
jgi:nitrile hydratase accessory protein